MSSDLAIIETLEDEIGKDLGELEQINFSTPISGYVIDDNENIIGLSIYHKGIKDLSVLKKLNKLTELYLKYNEIKDYSVLKELKNLTLLDLSYNQITDLSALKELKNLTLLYLSSNQITDLSTLKELKNLTLLYLSSNQITDLSALKELKNLTLLYLSSNQITDLSALKELKNLTLLDLSYNQITDLSALKELKNLTLLDLSYNQITDLSALKELKNLTQLDLSSNEITDLSVLKELKNLTQLDLSSNEITDLSALKELKNLTQLDLSSNEITDLSALKELKNLTQLDLSSNEITHLPSEIVDMGMDITREGVSGILLANNPLGIPPIEIEEQGKDAVKAYFKSLKGETQALNEVKVLLVGDGGAGKTSLVKQVLGEEFDKLEPQTQGIHLRDWKVGEIHVHFWDFGGQEIMHATHQFFLSKRSLYILVLDGRRDEKTEYWLKHIESFGGDSPILVVLNKIDENPSFEVNRRFLQEKYKGIKGFYRVSCANRDGIDVFTGALSKALANVELIRTSWPKTWYNVKTQLEAMKENFISIGEYKEMCMKEKITKKTNQDILVDFLNDLGVILHFKDFELLDTHVLDPKWLTNAVYRIINSKKLAACNGVLKLDLLDVILKKEAEDDYYYPSGKYRYIIEEI
jgi:small GTP-binding protein